MIVMWVAEPIGISSRSNTLAKNLLSYSTIRYYNCENNIMHSHNSEPLGSNNKYCHYFEIFYANAVTIGKLHFLF